MNKTLAHFKVLKKLGQGGMGSIYLARDMHLNRRIVLKLLPTQFHSNAFHKRRFRREAQAAAALKHPNIITVFELGEYDQGIYIAMEYIEGKALNEWIESGELKTLSVINIVIQVCRGLRKAHAAGILHRDIKPPNIMIDREGWVKILDFGLAKIRDVSQITKQGTRVGTIPYMSPEQIRGHDLDQRSDIYSLGVVLYQLLTRRLPFNGAHEDQIYYSILNAKPEPLARYKEGITDGLQRIVDKALEKDPAMRFQHVEEFLADLKRERKVYKNIVEPTLTLPVRASMPVKPSKGIPTPKSRSKWGIARVFSLSFALFAIGLSFAVAIDRSTANRVAEWVNLVEIGWARVLAFEPTVMQFVLGDSVSASNESTSGNGFGSLFSTKRAARKNNSSPHSPLVTKLSAISRTDDLLGLLNIYGQLMLVTVGNLADVGDAESCYVFVVDRSKVIARFQRRKKRFHDLDSARNLVSLAGHFSGKSLIWVRDHSVLNPMGQVNGLSVPTVEPLSVKSKAPGDELMVLVIEAQNAAGTSLHAARWQPDQLSRRGGLRLHDFRVLE